MHATQCSVFLLVILQLWCSVLSRGQIIEDVVKAYTVAKTLLKQKRQIVEILVIEQCVCVCISVPHQTARQAQ